MKQLFRSIISFFINKCGYIFHLKNMKSKYRLNIGEWTSQVKSYTGKRTLLNINQDQIPWEILENVCTWNHSSHQKFSVGGSIQKSMHRREVWELLFHKTPDLASYWLKIERMFRIIWPIFWGPMYNKSFSPNLPIVFCFVSKKILQRGENGWT